MSFTKGDASRGSEGAGHDVIGGSPGKITRSERLPVQRRAAATSPPPTTMTTLASAPIRGPMDDPFGLHLAGTVQRRAAGAASDDDVHAAAAAGTAGSAGPLPHQGAIQRSFGRHDVSGVRAHTDEAAALGSRAMGAEAFATGDHVAFAGAPSLHTAAHEAAHVVQQRAGVHLKGGVGEAGDVHERHADEVADRVVRGESSEALLDQYAGGGAGSAANGPVQRKVGLEFETNCPVRHKGSGEKVDYKTMIHAGAGWHIEADSSNMEFVTDPFQTWADLSKAVGLAAGMALHMQERANDAATRNKVPVFWNKWTVGDGDAIEIDSAPQATGGVPLDKIPEMFKTVAATKFIKEDDKLEHNSLMGMAESLDAEVPQGSAWGAEVVIDAIKEDLKSKGKPVPGHGFKKLEGLITVIMSYIGKGEEQKYVFSYSKLIAPIMARVNFAAMWDSLEDDEKPYLTPKWLLDPFGLAHDARVFKKGYGEKGDVRGGPTRAAWINSITDGKGPDLMSFGGNTTVAGGPSEDSPSSSGTSSGMGAMSEMDESPEGVKLAVLELRRLPKEAKPAVWGTVAKNVYDFFATLDPSLKDKPKPPAPEVPSVVVREEPKPVEQPQAQQPQAQQPQAQQPQDPH